MLALPTSHKVLRLRDYQQDGLDKLRASMRKGNKRIVLCAPTGSGKTEQAMALIQAAIEKNSRVAFIADRQILVTQTSRRAWDYGIQHGVLMGDQTTGTFENIRICSAQTIESRGMHAVDLIILDECHVRRHAIIEHAIKHDVPVIGLSATPLAPWMAMSFQDVVNVITTDELTRAGHLVPMTVYAPERAQIRTEGLKVKAGGEWGRKDVSERVLEVVGDAVGEWRGLIADKFNGVPQPTIAFAASVADSEALAEQFQDAGHDFAVLSYRQSSEEKDAIIRAFREGRHIGLVSCAVLERGFDAPETRIMIDCYPLRSSLMALLQRYGRVIRACEGKDMAYVLDCAGNYLAFQDYILDFFAHGVDALGNKRLAKAKRNEVLKRKDATCGACGAVYQPRARECHACGTPRPERVKSPGGGGGSMIVRKDGKLVVVDSSQREYGEYKGHRLYSQLYSTACEHKDPERAKKQALAQYKELTGEWPDRRHPSVVPIDPAIRNMVEGMRRAYAVRMAYARKKTGWDARNGRRTRTQFDKGYRHSPR